MCKSVNNKFSGYYWASIISLLGLVSITPILGIPRNYIATICLIFVGCILYSANGAFNYNRRLLTCLSLYFILVFSYKLIGVSDASWGNYLLQGLFFVPIILILISHNILHQKLIVCLFIAILIVVVFNIINNIRLFFLYPEMTISNMSMKEEDLQALNMGDSYFHTLSLLFFNVSILLTLNGRSIIVKTGMLLCAIISGVYICGFCLKASVVVYFFLSIVLLLLAKRFHKPQKIILVCFISALIIYLFVCLFKTEIVQFVIANSPDERITIRLITLIDSDNTLANQDTVDGRSELYFLSLKTWLSNPVNFLLGIGDHRALSDVESTGIGQHSEILDSLARYGIIGGYFLWVIFKKSFKFIISLFDNSVKSQVRAIIIVFIMCGFTKCVFSPSIGCVLFILLPLSSFFIKDSKLR